RDKPGGEPAEQAGNDPEPDLAMEVRELPDPHPEALPFRPHGPSPLKDSRRPVIEHGVDRHNVCQKEKNLLPEPRVELLHERHYPAAYEIPLVLFRQVR